MIKHITKMYIAIALVVYFYPKVLYALPTAKVTVKVVDEQQLPVSNAKVGIGFFVGGIKREISVVGTSNYDGEFAGTADSTEHVGIAVHKEGYYDSCMPYRFKSKKNFVWEPWNPELEVILRKIEKPVPMYARRLEIELPKTSEPIGFDLVACDWVPPYGKGHYSDFVFKLDKQYINNTNFDSKLYVKFSNSFDGIQLVKDSPRYGSRFRLPRFAPDNGYLGVLTRIAKREPDKYFETDIAEDNNYFFRIRSYAVDGKLVNAMYGKIQGDISYSVIDTNTAVVVFTYFLNPDLTRNMEFNPKCNLFKKLNSYQLIGVY